MINNKFVFNFSASYSGGGFKRLHAYARWFNENGGAWFLIHPFCNSLLVEFPNNNYFVVKQSKLMRVFNDCGYLQEVRDEVGVPDIYYSYGIPIYSKFGKLNWFHLSNVLPLGLKGIPLPLFDKLKLGYLGNRIVNNLKNADVISAESAFSLGLISPEYTQKFCVSVNGSDDELSFYHTTCMQKKDKIAVVIGTYSYKALVDSFRVFEMLHAIDDELTLVIIGDKKKVPDILRSNKNVLLTGILPRVKVVEYLKKAEFYISTTIIENSYNAAAEGIFFANESYISDIGPHRELIAGLAFEVVTVPKMERSLLRLKRKDISPMNLKTWDNVVIEMVDYVNRNNSNISCS